MLRLFIKKCLCVNNTKRIKARELAKWISGNKMIIDVDKEFSDHK